MTALVPPIRISDDWEPAVAIGTQITMPAETVPTFQGDMLGTNRNPADEPACQIRGGTDWQHCGDWCTDMRCTTVCRPFGRPQTGLSDDTYWKFCNRWQVPATPGADIPGWTLVRTTPPPPDQHDEEALLP